MRAKREGRLTSIPNMVLPTSAHAALEKGADYFNVESRRVDVGPDWRANISAMRAAVDDNTILIVGSAPQYPQGVVDPIVHIASIALERDINCHVDACMGGVTLPYLEMLGEEVAPARSTDHGLVYGNHPAQTRAPEPKIGREGPRLVAIRETPDQEAAKDGVTGRAKVPSWDEIMFGTSKKNDESSDL
jgi:hypothetical protein